MISEMYGFLERQKTGDTYLFSTGLTFSWKKVICGKKSFKNPAPIYDDY